MSILSQALLTDIDYQNFLFLLVKHKIFGQIVCMIHQVRAGVRALDKSVKMACMLITELFRIAAFLSGISKLSDLHTTMVTTAVKCIMHRKWIL